MKNISTKLLLLVICAALSACLPKEGERIPAKISFVSGTVLLNGKDARPDDFVKFGDVIETKARSSCAIIIDSENIIGMREDSVLVYKIKKESATIDLKNGFLGIIIKNKKNIQDFRVVTPTVTASVRGTVLFLGTETPTSTYTCICNGVIHYHAAGRPKAERHAAAHHKGITYAEKAGLVFDTPAGLKYHSDEDIEALAKIINVTIDWSKVSE